MSRDYLYEMLHTYWFAPPVALWRAIEIRVAAREQYAHPILDLGCGDGLIAGILWGQGAPAEAGIDPWPAQLRQAARSGYYCHVSQALGDRLPYPGGTFATVFSNSVLEHIPDVRPVVAEVGRVLQPGGQFIFTVPSDAFRQFLDGYARRAQAGDLDGAHAYARAVDAQLEHHHYHTPDAWRDLLAAGGMALVRAAYYMPEAVERFWDRANARYGIGRGARSPYGLLASPRLRRLGYQRLLQTWIAGRLSWRWRSLYEADVPAGEKGGGLLVVARRQR